MALYAFGTAGHRLCYVPVRHMHAAGLLIYCSLFFPLHLITPRHPPPQVWPLERSAPLSTSTVGPAVFTMALGALDISTPSGAGIPDARALAIPLHRDDVGRSRFSALFPCVLTRCFFDLRTDPQEVGTQGKLLLVGGDAGLLAGVDLRARSHVSETCI